MSRLPSKYLVHNTQVHYEQQPPLKYCGHFQIKAMLKYYKQQAHDYKQCCNSRFAKNIGLMLPNELSNSLTSKGLPSKHIITRNLPKTDRLNYIKERMLDTEGPHVIMMARLYNAMGEYRDIWTRKLLYHHYVSVWGYDDEQQMIYLYDSTRTKFPNSDQLPTGNFALPYEYFLHCWKRGGVQMLNFSLVTID